MRAFPVDALARMSHYGDIIALRDPVPDHNVDRAQMRIQAKVGTTSELVFNHDVPTVI